jgi:hypothetical protein
MDSDKLSDANHNVQQFRFQEVDCSVCLLLQQPSPQRSTHSIREVFRFLQLPRDQVHSRPGHETASRKSMS